MNLTTDSRRYDPRRAAIEITRQRLAEASALEEATRDLLRARDKLVAAHKRSGAGPIAHAVELIEETLRLVVR